MVFLRFFIATVLDILDGMIARHLGISTLQLRSADSFTDNILTYSVGISAWLVYKELIIPYLIPIVIVILFQLVALIIPGLKYKSYPAYPLWSSRFAGALLFLAAFNLFANQIARSLFLLAISMVFISCLESISISLILNQPTTDVRGVWYALRLRSSQLGS
jgi:CDP-diacylglycerol--glycerol-3-phosphate 3-phosphatidyltransferase